MEVASRSAGQRHFNIVPLKAQNTVAEVIAKIVLLILVLAFMAYLLFHG